VRAREGGEGERERGEEEVEEEKREVQDPLDIKARVCVREEERKRALEI